MHCRVSSLRGLTNWRTGVQPWVHDKFDFVFRFEDVETVETVVRSVWCSRVKKAFSTEGHMS